MRKNMARVIAAFKNQERARGDATGTCSTDGHNVWSYDMLIARRDLKGRVYVVNRKASPLRTTSSQIDALMLTFPDAIVFGAPKPDVVTGEAGRLPRNARRNAIPIMTVADCLRAQGAI